MRLRGLIQGWRSCLIGALAALLFLSAAGSAFASRAIILPSAGVLHGHGRGEVVAPQGARGCRITFHASGRPSASFDVRLGGPSRLAAWRIGRRVSGTWTATFACSVRSGTRTTETHSRQRLVIG